LLHPAHFTPKVSKNTQICIFRKSGCKFASVKECIKKRCDVDTTDWQDYANCQKQCETECKDVSQKQPEPEKKQPDPNQAGTNQAEP
jgi:hypothetical protein